MTAIYYSPMQLAAFDVADEFRTRNRHLWPKQRQDLWLAAAELALEVFSCAEPDEDDWKSRAYEVVVMELSG